MFDYSFSSYSDSFIHPVKSLNKCSILLSRSHILFHLALLLKCHKLSAKDMRISFDFPNSLSQTTFIL